jgi:hypothetical protein
VRGQARGGAPGDVLDQRRVRDDQPLADARVAFGLIPPPQFSQLYRFDVRLQGSIPPV